LPDTFGQFFDPRKMNRTGRRTMKFARWYLIINGLMLALYGAYCIYSPQFVADITAMTASTKAITEIRAMYGGAEFTLGLFFIVMASQPRYHEPGLIGLALLYGGLCSARALGIAIQGGDDYNTPAVIFETTAAALAVFGLIRLRKPASEKAPT
jgi:formate/nitrite transporter FocA (FNT family)